MVEIDRLRRYLHADAALRVELLQRGDSPLQLSEFSVVSHCTLLRSFFRRRVQLIDGAAQRLCEIRQLRGARIICFAELVLICSCRLTSLI